MTDHPENHISIKLFLGCLLTSDLRSQIHHSKKKLHPENLQEVQFQHKEYVGHFLPDPTITLEHLHQAQHQLLNHLQQSYPELSTDTLTITVFPQLFLA